MSDGSDFPKRAALMERETGACTSADVIIAISTFAEEKVLCMQKHYFAIRLTFKDFYMCFSPMYIQNNC